jgi:hypothetical protein
VLQENDWNVDAALSQWQEDVDWEKAQKKLPAAAAGGKGSQPKQRESQPLFGFGKKK